LDHVIGAQQLCHHQPDIILMLLVGQEVLAQRHHHRGVRTHMKYVVSMPHFNKYVVTSLDIGHQINCVGKVLEHLQPVIRSLLVCLVQLQQAMV
jgi:hypothetical protein